jgi:hypothetical protein
MTSARAAETPLRATARRYLEAVYYIAHEGEVPRPGRLAEWLGVSHPTVTVTLQKLERAGWLRVVEGHCVALSPLGEAAAAVVEQRPHCPRVLWRRAHVPLDHQADAPPGGLRPVPVRKGAAHDRRRALARWSALDRRGAGPQPLDHQPGDRQQR